jgi:hypothetical protein
MKFLTNKTAQIDHLFSRVLAVKISTNTFLNLNYVIFIILLVLQVHQKVLCVNIVIYFIISNRFSSFNLFIYILFDIIIIIIPFFYSSPLSLTVSFTHNIITIIRHTYNFLCTLICNKNNISIFIIIIFFTNFFEEKCISIG